MYIYTYSILSNDQELFSKVDTDGSGFIEFNEFIHILDHDIMSRLEDEKEFGETREEKGEVEGVAGGGGKIRGKLGIEEQEGVGKEKMGGEGGGEGEVGGRGEREV